MDPKDDLDGALTALLSDDGAEASADARLRDGVMASIGRRRLIRSAALSACGGTGLGLGAVLAAGLGGEAGTALHALLGALGPGAAGGPAPLAVMLAAILAPVLVAVEFASGR